MKKVALCYKHYPLSVGRFFRMAFERLPDVDPYNIGPFYDTIPWHDGILPHKYLDLPDYELFPEQEGSYLLDEALKEHLEAQGVEALIQFDAGFHLDGGWERPIALVGTDPHCLDYREQSKSANAFFLMQDVYSKDYKKMGGQAGYWPAPEWLPYAHDPWIHYWTPGVEPEYDVVFVGVIYPERRKLLDALLQAGLKVLARQGVLYHEGTALYAQGKIALNLSSRWDLPMRFYEGMGYRRAVLTNYVPDMALLAEEGCVNGVQYHTYETENTGPFSDTIPKADSVIAETRNLLEDDRWRNVADAGYVWVQRQTYDARARAILASL